MAHVRLHLVSGVTIDVSDSGLAQHRELWTAALRDRRPFEIREPDGLSQLVHPDRIERIEEIG